MKILITTDWYVPVINGVVTSVINLKNQLTKMGHDVRVLTLQQESDVIVDKTYYVKSMSAKTIYPNARIICSTAKKEINAIIEWKPNIIHSQCEFNTCFLSIKIAKKLKIPIVHTYHTVYEDYIHYIKGSPRVNRKLIGKLSKRILKNMYHVVAPTNKVKNILLKYQINQPISVIPTGIDIECYQEKVSGAVKDKIKNQYRIPQNNTVMLFLGRLAKEKNVEEIMDYLNKSDVKNITFLIVGDGPNKEALQRYAKSIGINDQVVFTGMIEPSHVKNYYQTADLFVSASTSETQGLTYIEALANGLPSLCRSDSCLEGVILDYHNGFQYNNYEEFKSFLLMVHEQDDVKMMLSENAVDYSKVFSCKNFTASLEALYIQVILEYSKETIT
ncbi:glycosyltransferase [Vallitalea okinawensis]|uniref:glycosyltransferase n=1 Tax=Vallitalea okinawensis TaxID=2078660 RepID=UPI000CFE0DDA|nr:glycosyltransferase [Vallitalea okinawensis]